MPLLMSHRDTPPAEGYFGLFNDSFPPILDGVTLTVENYARWLNVKGMTPAVVTPWNPVRTDVDYTVMRFFSLPIPSRHPYRYGYPKLDPFIWHRLRKTPFRLLHAHCPFSSGRLAVYVKKSQDVPLIGTFHSKYRSDLEHSFKSTPWCVPIIMRRIINFFNACDEVWIPQAQVEPTVREYGYKGRLTVVENGNDYADMIIGPLSEYKRSARRRLALPDDTVNLLFVGQHIWEKGLKVIVDALSSIKGDVKFRMNFVGTGYALPELRRMIEERGLSPYVEINGVVHERKALSDYYAASDLFLFPSYYDNAPLVLREAAAFGTPAILVDGSTASEVISDGRNGFLAGNSGKAYADIIRRLAADRSHLSAVGEEARSTIVRSWEDVVEEVADRYRTILRLHARSGYSNCRMSDLASPLVIADK